MPFTRYTAQDFALHPEFRMWVLQPNRELNEYWSNWLTAHPEKLALVEEARILVENTPFKVDRLEEDEFQSMIDAIEQTLDNDDLPSEQKTIPLNSYAVTGQISKNRRATSRKKWLRIAAAIAILIASAYIFGFIDRPLGKETNPFITEVSPAGQIRVIEMIDGSKIWLNAGSSIRFRQDFTPSARDIFLEGEAFFEVANDSTRPFTVYAGNISTTALGTSFNIHHFEENTFTDVSLISGKVAVNYLSEAEGETLTLVPGEAARLDTENFSFTKTLFDKRIAIGWKEGIIYFSDASFENVKNTLERMYNIKIHTTNNTNHNWSYNGQFDNENLNLVLKKIALTEDFEFTIRKNQVEITFNR